MNTNLKLLPDVDELASRARQSRAWVEMIRDVVRSEAGTNPPHEWRAGLPASQMKAAMSRLKEERQRLTLPPDEVDALVEQNRLDFGRGTFADQSADDGR
jgi:hypothetical protein